MDTSLILLPPGQRSCPICRYSFASHFSLISSSFSICEFFCIFLSSCSCPLSFKSRHKKYDNLFQPSPPLLCLSVCLPLPMSCFIKVAILLSNWTILSVLLKLLRQKTRLVTDLSSRRSWRFTSAQLWNKFGCYPTWTLSIALAFYKHNWLPLGPIHSPYRLRR